jgi:hypothetical protein
MKLHNEIDKFYLYTTSLYNFGTIFLTLFLRTAYISNLAIFLK